MARMAWWVRVGLVLVLLCSCLVLSLPRWHGEPAAETSDVRSVSSAQASSRQWAASFSDFHCQRNFDALATMTSLAKADRTQNCNFSYFSVEAAWAEVRCSHVYAEATSTTAASAAAAAAEDGQASAERNVEAKSSCNVTLHVRLRVAADARQRLLRQMGSTRDYAAILSAQGSDEHAATLLRAERAGTKTAHEADVMVLERNDPWRFTLQLRARGESTVHYKGYDGAGYSVCCELLQQHRRQQLQDSAHRGGSGDREEEVPCWCEWLQAERGDYDHDVDDTSLAAVPPERVIRACPLPIVLPEADGSPPPPPPPPLQRDGDDEAKEEHKEERVGGQEQVIEGQISKPLHRYVPGAWQVRLQLMRRRSAYHVWLTGQDESASAAGADNSNKDSKEEEGDDDGLEMLGRVVVPFGLPRVERSDSRAMHESHQKHREGNDSGRASSVVAHSTAHAQAASEVLQDDL